MFVKFPERSRLASDVVSAAAVQIPPKAKLVIGERGRDGMKNMPNHVGITPQSMPSAVLVEMAALLPEYYRAEAIASVDKLNKFNMGSLIKNAPMKELRLIGRYAVKRSKADCESALENTNHDSSTPFWQAICQSAELRWIFLDGIHQLLNQFSETPTLKDTFDIESAEEVFNLGKLLTYIRLSRYSSKYPFPEALEKLEAVWPQTVPE